METYQPDVFNKDCPSQQVLSRVANKWVALTICALAGGPKRYNQLKRQIGGVSQKMLTQTLRNLEYDHLVSRKVYPTVPPQVEYSLTNLGKSIFEPLQAICTWTERNLPELKNIWKKQKKMVAEI